MIVRKLKQGLKNTKGLTHDICSATKGQNEWHYKPIALHPLHKISKRNSADQTIKSPLLDSTNKIDLNCCHQPNSTTGDWRNDSFKDDIPIKNWINTLFVTCVVQPGRWGWKLRSDEQDF